VGTFGSLDWNGDQVDDGVYEIVDDRTFTIGDATFHFEVQGDDSCSSRCWTEAIDSIADGWWPSPSWQDVGARALRTATRERCVGGGI
jgi:hypothetical protein